MTVACSIQNLQDKEGKNSLSIGKSRGEGFHLFEKAMQHLSHPPAHAFLYQVVCLAIKLVFCDSTHSIVPWLLDADANSEQHSACLEHLSSLGI